MSKKMLNKNMRNWVNMQIPVKPYYLSQQMSSNV